MPYSMTEFGGCSKPVRVNAERARRTMHRHRKKLAKKKRGR